MYAPMLVVEVWTLRDPSALRLSAGRPDCSSVIATNEAHVSLAYRCSASREPAAIAPAAGRTRNTITASAATPVTLRAVRPMSPPTDDVPNAGPVLTGGLPTFMVGRAVARSVRNGVDGLERGREAYAERAWLE